MRATYETIAHANYGFNTIPTLIQLLTEATNMHIKCPRISVVAIPPNTIQQLLSRNDSIGASCKHRQEGELLVRKSNLGPFANYTYIVEIDEQVIILISLAHRFIRATHDCSHSGQKLADRERLRNVVVGAEIKTSNAIGF